VSIRLKILSGEARCTYPYLSTQWIAETLEIEPESVEMLAKLEEWNAVTREYVHEGKIETEELWDGMTIPKDRRMLLATQHYLAEEHEHRLMDEAYEEARKIEAFFPQGNFEVYMAALYRARQFSQVKDTVISFGLSLRDAITAISDAFCMPPSILVNINTVLDNGDECAFIRMDDDMRYAMLLHYHVGYYGEFFPEFETMAEAICQ